MSNILDLQCALYGYLQPLMAPIPVYDHVPQQETPTDEDFPFIVIGDDFLTNWDDDEKNGFLATVTIHIFDRYRGSKGVKEIQGQLYDLLHRHAITPIGDFAATELTFVSSTVITDPDGITRHGVQVFEVYFSDPVPGLTEC